MGSLGPASDDRSRPIASLLAFVAATLATTLQPLPLLLALALAPLLKGWLQTVLVLIDLCLLAELLATLAPGYHFGTLLVERLVASGVQLTIAYGALTCWRYRRVRSASVSAH
jgi:hypothetical protein